MIDFHAGQTCPICESGIFVEKEKLFSFDYKGSNFSKNITVLSCSSCEEEFIKSCDEKTIDIEAIAFRRRVDGLLTPKEIRDVRERFDLTQDQIAKILKIGAKNFSRYENGKFAQPQGIDLVLRSISLLGRDYLEVISRFTNVQLPKTGPMTDSWFQSCDLVTASNIKSEWPGNTKKVNEKDLDSAPCYDMAA